MQQLLVGLDPLPALSFAALGAFIGIMIGGFFTYVGWDKPKEHLPALLAAAFGQAVVGFIAWLQANGGGVLREIFTYPLGLLLGFVIGMVIGFVYQAIESNSRR